MGYAILACEALAVGWFAFALLGVLAGRTRSSVGRALIDAATWIVVPAPWLFLVAAGAFLRTRFTVPQFWWLVGLTVIFLIGSVVVWVRGRSAGRASRASHSAELAGANAWSPAWLALGLAIAVLLLNSTFASLDAAVRQHLSDVRTEADTLAASVAPRPLADHENAAAIYIQLGDYFGRDSGPFIWPTYWSEAVQMPVVGYGASAPSATPAPFDYSRQDLTEFLATQRGARQLVLTAAARPGCYFDRDYSRPRYDMRLPEIQDLRQSAFLLAVDARNRSTRGDTAGALENIQALYRMADHAATDPLIVCVLVGIAIDRLATDVLQHVLQENPPTSDQLQGVVISPGVSHAERLDRAMRMEEAASLGVFSDFDQRGAAILINEHADEIAVLGKSALYRVFILPGDLAGYRRFQRAVGGTSVARSYRELQIHRQEARKMIDRERAGPVTMLLTPALEPAMAAVAKGESARRLAVVGLAMYRYRADHGQFPDALPALSPDYLPIIPRDPFDGQPLRLRIVDGVHTVYSVGVDEVDNGGAPPSDHELKGDLLFECKLPKVDSQPEPAAEPEKAE
ncbi:MAG: hypothetical protein JNG90_20200 [Planctomycetaceae bacterium]|nr:hypothetical protein [Planctomycetaceae bacterium]